jgi:hypothetical protein
MKKLLLPVLSLSVMLLLSGCLSFGSNDSKTEIQKPTVGQQLMDLKKAKDAGVLTDEEFQAQKQKLLAGK